MPRKPFVKSKDTKFLKNQNFLLGNIPRNKQSQQYKSEKIQASVNSPFGVNSSGQAQRKSKIRGHNKNVKMVNRPTGSPTVQTMRGLSVVCAPKTGGGVRMNNSKARCQSTPNPIRNATVIAPTTKSWTYRPISKPNATAIATESFRRQGLILMEPAIKSATNNVPKVFQQYPKIQQLYPLYPVYDKTIMMGQHATRAKGLDLLQDEQFNSRNHQLTKGTQTIYLSLQHDFLRYTKGGNIP